MDKEKVIKSGQEQAIGAWVDYLNQVRLNGLVKALSKQKDNFQEATSSLNLTFEQVHNLIDSNRGGNKGMHGFIAEIAECGIGNARRKILGEVENYKWVNDNGPADLLRNGVKIQQKFVQSGGQFSLNAVAEHLKKYPEFINNGGKYQVPEDHYEKIKTLLAISEKNANRLPSNGDLTLRDWKVVHNFFNENNVPVDSLEASKLSYDSVQVNRIDDTLGREKESLKKTNDERCDSAYRKSRPNLQEGGKATAWSAVIECGTTFVIDLAKRIKAGKPLNKFNEDDWKEIVGDTCLGVAKGSVRGASIYVLTNYTATPGAVASGVVTASFGIAEQAQLYRKGQLSEVEFIENAEIVALDASVSALSSLVGQVVIPVPVLGAVIGNSVGMILYQVAKGNLSDKEESLIKEYIENQRVLDEELGREYAKCMDELSVSMQTFLVMLENAFSPNVEVAFDSSINLCMELGVPAEEVLDTKEKVDAYFLE